jgi:hypothetical protein
LIVLDRGPIKLPKLLSLPCHETGIYPVEAAFTGLYSAVSAGWFKIGDKAMVK